MVGRAAKSKSEAGRIHADEFQDRRM